MKTCSVGGCNRRHRCRGYCDGHYQRLLASGDVRPNEPLRSLPTADERGDIAARILAECSIVPDTGCIEWGGYTLPDSGYGTISWNSRQWVVHRAMWTVKVGPIPTDDDWTIDHLCRNRVCVNVKHLEVVTRIENSRRGGGILRAQSANKIRWIDECRNGHPRTPENTAIYNGSRCCRDCKRAAWARYATRRATS